MFDHYQVRMIPLFILACSLFCSLLTAGAEGIGVNYGTLGDDLPPPLEAVALIKAKNITNVRLFRPDAAILQALQSSGLGVVLGSLNEDLPCLAADAACAQAWVDTNVLPFSPTVHFRYIAAGNEVIPGELAEHVLPAMANLEAALRAAGLGVPVTTAVATLVLGAAYPPSQGAFSESAAPVLGPVVSFLAARNAPLLVNVYPYFACAADPAVPLDYALLSGSAAPVGDGSLVYTNMFDAMVDAVRAALEKAGGEAVAVVVSETGWPSAGGAAATVANAAAYVNNVIEHVKIGTPRRPGEAVETYVFALFDENQKPEGVEQHFGLFRPDKTEVYRLANSSGWRTQRFNLVLGLLLTILLMV